jgi:hypothetical protein
MVLDPFFQRSVNSFARNGLQAFLRILVFPREVLTPERQGSGPRRERRIRHERESGYGTDHAVARLLRARERTVVAASIWSWEWAWIGGKSSPGAVRELSGPVPSPRSSGERL